MKVSLYQFSTNKRLSMTMSLEEFNRFLKSLREKFRLVKDDFVVVEVDDYVEIIGPTLQMKK